VECPQASGTDHPEAPRGMPMHPIDEENVLDNPTRKIQRGPKQESKKPNNKRRTVHTIYSDSNFLGPYLTSYMIFYIYFCPNRF